MLLPFFFAVLSILLRQKGGRVRITLQPPVPGPAVGGRSHQTVLEEQSVTGFFSYAPIPVRPEHNLEQSVLLYKLLIALIFVLVQLGVLHISAYCRLVVTEPARIWVCNWLQLLLNTNQLLALVPHIMQQKHQGSNSKCYLDFRPWF